MHWSEDRRISMMLEPQLLVGLLVVLCLLLYVFLAWNFGHWRRRGVREPKAWPLFGSFPNIVWPRQHFTNDMRDLYMYIDALRQLSIGSLLFLHFQEVSQNG